MEIKLKDVKEFLEENSFCWEDVLIVNNGRNMYFIKKVNSLEDDILLAYVPLKEHYGKIANSKEKSIEIGLADFVVNSRGENKSFVFEKSLREEWINFLLAKYGKEYKEEVEKVYSIIEKNIYEDCKNSLIKLDIKQRQIEDRYAKAHIKVEKTKNKKISFMEREKILQELSNSTTLMLSGAVTIGKERGNIINSASQKLKILNEAREKVSSYEY